MSLDSNTDFIPTQFPSLSASTDEPNLQNSDQEDTTSAANRDDSCTDTDYWFGKIYFRCVLAQEVFNRTTPGCSILAVDDLLQRQLDQFPYQSTLQACEKQRLSNSESRLYARQGKYRTSLSILIGCVIRKNSSESKRKILQLLRANNEIGQSVRSYRQKLLTDTDIPETEPQADRVPLLMEEPDLDLGKYTSALKERLDVVGFRPKYNFQNTSQTPPIFKAVVSFQEYVFEGRGRSKQQAKHEASREACRFLDLQVS